MEREKRPRDDSDPWTDEHCRLEILGDNKVVIHGMNGACEVREKSMPSLWVVSLINLCGGTWAVLSGRELMRLIGVGTLSVSFTKKLIHMPTG